MFGKLALLFVCVAVGSGNPAADKPWKWKSPKPLVEARGVPGDTYIVGGTETTPNAYPHQVALFIDDMYFCGGSIISNEWILTAAHCMNGAIFVDVVMGAHNVRENETTQVTMRSTDFIVHRSYVAAIIANDIAVIRLPAAVAFTAEISSIGLASSDPPAGTIVMATGWGKPSDNATGISDVLREVEAPVMANPDCNAVYGIITNKQICIDTIGGKGTCNGDSGGPLTYEGKIIGITSFGSSSGCEVDFPAAFSRVTSFLTWISDNTGVTP